MLSRSASAPVPWAVPCDDSWSDRACWATESTSAPAPLRRPTLQADHAINTTRHEQVKRNALPVDSRSGEAHQTDRNASHYVAEWSHWSNPGSIRQPLREGRKLACMNDRQPHVRQRRDPLRSATVRAPGTRASGTSRLALNLPFRRPGPGLAGHKKTFLAAPARS